MKRCQQPDGPCYAPFRSEVWLLLAEMAGTAPYNLALAELRLSVATRGNAVRDPGLRQLPEVLVKALRQ
jgi:hypothetical protein